MSLLRAIGAAADAVQASADRLNRLDGQAGDGDLGVTMTIGARVVRELLPGLEGQPPAAVLRACGAALARRAPSTSGTLVATALLRAARVVDEEAGATALARALRAAQEGIQERGKARPGGKTMLDALAPAVVAAEAAAGRGAGIGEALRAAAVAAEAGAQATREMLPGHGRASWLAERSAGHEDAGARLVAILLQASAGAAGGDV
ncbi:MAG TPA: DAK2 domain-containing protein [Candidatus Dormibacteraeota bacterium]|nr:DAK2 domain-containing protein [Candidatus Dormibacteraeota bacterium]